MIWLEMISIRTAGTAETGKVFEICEECRQTVAAEELMTMIVYCSARYETDVSIHFQWKSDPGPGSALGLEVVSALKDLGLISHTFWVEKEEIIAGMELLPQNGRNRI